MTLPLHTFAKKTTGSGVTVPDGDEGDDYIQEVQFESDFSYIIEITAETKAADGGGGGTGGTGGGTGGGGSPPATPVVVTPISISVNAQITGVTATVIPPNKLKIAGSYRTAFDDTYQFVRLTGETVFLPPDTTEVDIALIKYTMPSQTRRLFEYNIAAVWASGSEWEGTPTPTSIPIRQYARWTTVVATENIAKLKDWRYSASNIT